MRETAGTTFSIGRKYAPIPGCTTSVCVHESEAVTVTHFGLAARTDISAETHPQPRLLIVDAGSVEAFAKEGSTSEGSRTWRLGQDLSLLMPTDVPVGMRAKDGCVYTELTLGRGTVMNEAVQAGEVFELGSLVPYREGTIVNMDVAHNGGMKLAVMSFDAGCGLQEHAAPGEALVFAPDGEGVIGYEGEEHVIRAGQNFKFDRGGRHYVRADKRFKMALLLTLE